MIKKFLTWIFKRENSPIVILFLLVVPLYIIFLGTYINEKTTNFLLSMAAVISTVFLYLALRENWKTNHLKTIEPKFNDLLSRVKYFEERSSQCIFTEPYSISSKIYFPGDLISTICSYNFLKLIDLFNAVREDHRYKTCIEMLGTNDIVTLEDNECAKEIDVVMNQLIEAHRNLWHFHFNLSFLIPDIEESDLLDDQKKYLLERISEIHKDFSTFYKNLSNEKSPDYLMYKNFYIFKIFKLFETNNIGLYASELQWQFVFSTCKRNEKIFSKYLK